MTVIPRHLPLPPATFIVPLLLLLAAPTAAQPAAEEAPCRGEAYRRLDFWVGVWRVVDAEGQELGRNRIELAEGGCLLMEHWSSARGGTGRSMNYFDPEAGLWRQSWVAASGGVVRYQGDVEAGILRYEGVNITPDGSSRPARSMIEQLPDGRLHHRIEHSGDGGESWDIVVFDAFYEPVDGQLSGAPTAPATARREEAETAPASPAASPPAAPVEPAAAAPAAPATTEAPTAEGVKAVSSAAPAEAIPLDRRQRVEMASPMTLEIPLGPLHQYPDNSAWSTEDTAIYSCDGVSVRRLEVSRRARRGTMHLEARLHLLGDRRSQRIDAEVELVSAGEVIARAGEENVALGYMVSSYDPEEGLRLDLPMSLDLDRFEEIFTEGDSPILRVRLTVPE